MPDHGGDAVLQELLRGKKMWHKDPREAGPVLKDAYLAAQGPVLAAIVETHTMANPILPRLDILDYPRGSYHDFDKALAAPPRSSCSRSRTPTSPSFPIFRASRSSKSYRYTGTSSLTCPRSLKACTKLRKINIFRNPMVHVPAVLYEMPSLEQVLMGDAFAQDEVAKLQEQLPKAEIR